MTTDAVGGVWTYTLELAGALADAGIEVGIVVLGPRPDAAQLAQLALIPCCRVFEVGGALEWMDDPWDDVDGTGESLIAIAAEFAPDLVHLNDYCSASLPWNCPRVLVAHSCVVTWWRSVKGEAAPSRYAEYRRRVRAGLLAADVVITPTTAHREQIEREYDLVLNAMTISNARGGQSFQPCRKQARIVSAGRLWDEGKNLRLLDAIAPEVHWEIGVAGPTKLENVCPFQGKCLRSLGQLGSAEMADVLAHAAIYAAPARYEPFGLAILEAALSGCALVLSDIPTLREVWEGAARFVPCNQPDAWVSALNELAIDCPARAALQSAARTRGLTFSPARQAMEYRNLYRSLVADKAVVSSL